MILQILDIDSLALLRDKTCIDNCLNKYKNYPQNDWLDGVCGKSPFVDTKYVNLPDITFDMSADNPNDTDFNNVKAVYEALKFLSDSNASEERLWAALCLGIGYTYVQYRWPSKSVDNVYQHYFFGFGNRRSLTRNALSRLWWIGRLTYDKTRSDPYELTKFVCSKGDYIMHFIERNTSNNIHVLRPFLEAIMEAQAKGYDINTDDAGELSKYLNLLGGTYILDFMPEEWIKNKITSRIENIIAVEEVSSDADVSISDDNRKVKINSKVILQAEKNGSKILIPAKKNKFRTTPSSLINLSIGDSVKIGKNLYRIVGLR